MYCKNCRRDVATYTDINGKVKCCICQTVLKVTKPKVKKEPKKRVKKVDKAQEINPINILDL